MKLQHFFFALWLCAFDFCAFAAPKTPVEIKSPQEIQRYKRLKNEAEQRAQPLHWAKIQARIEQRKDSVSSAILVSPDKRKYLRVTGYLPDVWYRASIHDAKSGALLIQLPSPREEVGGAYNPQWSPDSKNVSLSEVANSNALFFDAKSGKKLWEGDQYYLYAPQGQTLALTGGKTIVFCNSRSGKVLRSLPNCPTTYGLALEFFSPDGSQLYVRATGNDTRRWRLSTR